MGKPKADKNTFDFGTAIRYLKEGKLVSRIEWSAEERLLFLLGGEKRLAAFISINDRIPISLKNRFSKTNDLNSSIKLPPIICMKTEDNTIVRGWNAGQTDILAEDWFIFE